MEFVVFLILAIIAIVIFQNIRSAILAKYRDFVIENSISIAEMKKINTEFSFFSIDTFDESHTYDNLNYYQDISCEDYLIYQLQFKSKQILQAIQRARSNRLQYDTYCSEIKKRIHVGTFQQPIKKIHQEKFLKIEKRLLRGLLKSPTTSFSLTIYLKRSDLRGRVYNRKSEIFDEDTLIELIKRLSNKSGNFYRDREIWDSICRVERGKVSNKMRFSVYRRDGYRCRYCGRTEQTASLEIDHICPVSKGGKSEYDNLQTLCRQCNMNKGNRI